MCSYASWTRFVVPGFGSITNFSSFCSTPSLSSLSPSFFQPISHIQILVISTDLASDAERLYGFVKVFASYPTAPNLTKAPAFAAAFRWGYEDCGGHGATDGKSQTAINMYSNPLSLGFGLDFEPYDAEFALEAEQLNFYLVSICSSYLPFVLEVG